MESSETSKVRSWMQTWSFFCHLGGCAVGDGDGALGLRRSQVPLLLLLRKPGPPCETKPFQAAAAREKRLELWRGSEVQARFMCHRDSSSSPPPLCHRSVSIFLALWLFLLLPPGGYHVLSSSFHLSFFFFFFPLVSTVSFQQALVFSTSCLVF